MRKLFFAILLSLCAFGTDYVSLGNNQYALGNFNKAIEFYNKALLLNPKM